MQLLVAAVFLVGANSQTTVINRNTEVSIPKSKQESYDGKTQFYRIIVNPDTEQAYVAVKRYSEFSDLYNELATNMPGQTLFENAVFPGRSWGASLTADQIEDRRLALEQWLKAAIEMLPEFPDREHEEQNQKNHQTLYTFLDPVSGDASRTSGIMMPADSFKLCLRVHFYGIHVQKPGERGYYVYRRFNMFDDLQKKLGKASLRLPGNVEFPYATLPIWTQAAEDERRRALERWLQEVVNSPSGKSLWKDKLDKFLSSRDAKLDFLQCVADTAGVTVADLMFDDTEKCPPCNCRDEL